MPKFSKCHYALMKRADNGHLCCSKCGYVGRYVIMSAAEAKSKR